MVAPFAQEGRAIWHITDRQSGGCLTVVKNEFHSFLSEVNQQNRALRAKRFINAHTH